MALPSHAGTCSITWKKGGSPPDRGICGAPSASGARRMQPPGTLVSPAGLPIEPQKCRKKNCHRRNHRQKAVSRRFRLRPQHSAAPRAQCLRTNPQPMPPLRMCALISWSQRFGNSWSCLLTSEGVSYLRLRRTTDSRPSGSTIRGSPYSSTPHAGRLLLTGPWAGNQLIQPKHAEDQHENEWNRKQQRVPAGEKDVLIQVGSSF